MHSAMLAEQVGKVICTDFSDQNARFGGEFVKLLHEKFERNGYSFPIEKFEFHEVDATRLIYRDELFDGVVSFNAFEHIPDPQAALAEIFRVTKPGGLIYVSFDPIWTSDSGSHFQHRVAAPWDHLLTTDGEFGMKIIEAGGSAGEVNEYRHAMNRRRLCYYRDMFAKFRARGNTVSEMEWSGCTHPENVHHANFIRCQAEGYSKEELLFRGMYKLIKKNWVV